MPGMSGEYATSIIKKNGRNMNYRTPVIFLTANTSEEARLVCLEARGAEVLAVVFRAHSSGLNRHSRLAIDAIED